LSTTALQLHRQPQHVFGLKCWSFRRPVSNVVCFYGMKMMRFARLFLVPTALSAEEAIQKASTSLDCLTTCELDIASENWSSQPTAAPIDASALPPQLTGLISHITTLRISHIFRLQSRLTRLLSNVSTLFFPYMFISPAPALPM
jgi:hypothetical protein